jgi:hypothetical protein
LQSNKKFEINLFSALPLGSGASGGPSISSHVSTLETQILPVLIVRFMPVTFEVKESL